MLQRNKKSTFFFLFLLSFSVFSQTKEDLKKQKESIEKDIKYTTELLNKTKQNKTKSLSYLKALDKQINNKEMLLQNTNVEIKLLNKQIINTEQLIVNTQSLIASEKNNLESLKNEYEKMILAFFKKKGSRKNLIFIISSEDFNQAYKRTLYLKQYASSRKKQTKKITKSKQELETKKSSLSIQKNQLAKEYKLQKELAEKKQQELNLINTSKQEKQSVIKNLVKSEALFKKQLKEKERQSKNLEEKIRKIIEEEIYKARENIKNNNKSFSLTPESIELSAEFSSNKGKLPWPLEKGVIVQGYGKQKHVIFSGVETFNNGIDIATDINANVRAVFDGTVSRIFFIKGEGKAVLMNHGEYFSVYSGLKEVSVKAGEKLLAKEKIGVVLTEELDQKTELHFEIWMGYEKKDPSKWLYKAY